MAAGQIHKTACFYDGMGRLVRVVGVDPNGTELEMETYSYSPEGRKTKVYFVPKLEPNTGFSYAIEGTEQSYSVQGASNIATVYDAEAQPEEVLFYDSEHRLLQGVILQRDTAGRLVREEIKPGEPMAFPGMQAELGKMEPKASEAVAAIFASVFGPHSATTYLYDEKGRMLERYRRMGDVGEFRTTFRYDDRNNKIEEINEDTSRELQIDGEGNVQPAQERFDKRTVRLEYQYDPQENWTECVV